MATKKTGKGVKTPVYQCPFCDKKYKTENRLLIHKCVKRDRYNDRESRQMRTGLQYWLRFMEIYHIQIKQNIEPMMQFIKSKYFNDFYDFACYILDNPILRKEEFVEEVLTSGKPVFEWRSHNTYKEWVLKVTRYEHPKTGLERSIMAIQEWSITTNNDWTTFFECVSTDRAIMWFETGQLSPWIIYIAPKEVGDKLLTRFSDTEGRYLLEYINPLVWKPLSLRYNKEILELRQILKECGL